MSDIYKQREAMPVGKNDRPKRRRKPRSTKTPEFDSTHKRKRRSKNSGLRRLLHLMRKSNTEKYIWASAGVAVVVIVAGVAIWQFVIVEYRIGAEEDQISAEQSQPSIPEQPDSATE